MNFIPISSTNLSKLEERYLLDAFESGWVSSSGPYIDKLREVLPQHLGTRYATPVSNGTTALHLALLALGIGPGDEVIVPNLSFVAVVNAVLYCGATPILCDIEPSRLSFDLTAFESSITEKTRCVIVVHNYGFFSDVSKIQSVIGERQISVIEDCAEAPFLTYDGIQTGTKSHISTYSFFGNKIVTSGEGGCVASNDANLIEKVDYLKNQANIPEKKFVFEDTGFNYRMTNLQAAILVAQLERRDELLQTRYDVFSNYIELLDGIEGIEVLLPDSLEKISPWILSVRVDPTNKLNLMRHLNENLVDTRPFFSPHSRSSRFTNQGSYPNSDLIFESCFNLPTYSGLTRDQIFYISKIIVSYLNTAS